MTKRGSRERRRSRADHRRRWAPPCGHIGQANAQAASHLRVKAAHACPVPRGIEGMAHPKGFEPLASAFGGLRDRVVGACWRLLKTANPLF